jgi:hypothetical protein
LTNINNEDKTVPLAVEKALPQIEIILKIWKYIQPLDIKHDFLKVIFSY